MLLPYQDEYIRNTKEILGLGQTGIQSSGDFDLWFSIVREKAARAAYLKKRNMDILNGDLFPLLDNLHAASDDEIRSLEEFADVLLDWNNNLDRGICVTIHDALLSLCRVRKDRNGIIRELYKLGMGLFYLNRMVMGIDDAQTNSFYFENEMVFTEASAYLRFFDEIEDDTTRGYILRSLHNIAICVRGSKRKVAASARMLNVIKDEHYRAVAPSLPWDRFLRGVHQQMSSNRAALSGENLTGDELTLILDSCYEVFKSEETSSNPNIKWLWPYYEMEFTCGYVDLRTTMVRMERLIEQTPQGQFDSSGLYGNIQLPIYYGRLLRRHPELQKERHCLDFASSAYERMYKTILALPVEEFSDTFLYDIILIVSDFFEIEGAVSYKQLVSHMMQKFSPDLYVNSRKTGDIMALLCGAVLDMDSGFFDGLPVLESLPDGSDKRQAILDYAFDCGLFHDFGQLKMGVSRTLKVRNLLDREFRMFMLHCVSGYENLKIRESTRHYADIALGHHRWYGGEDGYPEKYVRTASPYRQMTDVAAVASYLVDGYDANPATIISDLLKEGRRRFSPMVTACLSDANLASCVSEVLSGDGEKYYREIHATLAFSGSSSGAGTQL
ncbi:MAG: hypothetical protein IKP61_02875 [Spirochaetales bacterium]|nr:hypothetical protein [Spirochaetales bacterium]